MRFGFTTGSCAAAAAKAAAFMLLGGNVKNEISIKTPKGIMYNTQIIDITTGNDYVSCGVVKDGGDDPDVTSGSTVYAKVSLIHDDKGHITIDGGEGVGRVTKPGLDQNVGSAAINSVPRQMIEKEVAEMLEAFDCRESVKIVISVPGGKEIAEKTFNPRLGIEGGISILGTSGIVEPMSTQAILDTIKVELNQKKAMGASTVVIAPGNYGVDFIKQEYGYNLNNAVKCSNYIGATLDLIAELGFEKTVLCAHIGKLIKVSGGIMNTHSKEADCRMELMMSSALHAGADIELLNKISNCVTTDAAYNLILKAGIAEAFMRNVMDKTDFYLKKRAAGRFEIEAVAYSNEFGLMGETPNARALMKEFACNE